MSVGVWKDSRSRQWVFKKPSDTQAVLEGSLCALAMVNESTSKGSHPGSRELAPLLDYLAEVTLGLRSSEGHKMLEGLTFFEWRDVLDSELGVFEWVEYLNAIVSSVSIPPDTLSDISEYFTILYEKACDCPKCKGVVTKRQIPCAYDGLSSAIYPYLNRYGVVSDDPVLTAPFWVFQIKEIEKREVGKIYRKQQEESQKAERQKSIDEMIKSKGAWRN